MGIWSVRGNPVTIDVQTMTLDASDQTRSSVHALYRRYRRRTRNALLGVITCVTVIIIFRNHRAWGDGDAAYALYIAGYVIGLISALVAFRANGDMWEQRGLYQGKFGSTPEK
jgi:hypothetical protein